LVGEVERRVLMIEFELIKEHSLREEWGVCIVDGPWGAMRERGANKVLQNG